MSAADSNAGGRVTPPPSARPTVLKLPSSTPVSAATSAMSSPSLMRSAQMSIETQENDKVTHEPEQSAASDDVGFLTRRLKSAIGQDLTASSEDSEEAAGTHSRSTTRSQSPVKSRRNTNRAAASEERGWSSFLSMPRLADLGLGDTKPSGNNEEPAEQPAKNALSTYTAAFDPRTWFNNSTEAGPSKSRSLSSAQDQASQKLKVPASSNPSQGVSTGSFPASATKKKRDKSRKESQSIGTGSHMAKNAEMQEHDLTKQQLGLQGEDPFPDHEFLVLSTAGKPIFSSTISKARLIRAQARRARRRRKHEEMEQHDGDADLAQRHALEEDELTSAEQALQDEEDQMMATRVGLVQALISNYAEQGNDLLNEKSREFLELLPTSRTRYLLKPPLYLVAIAQWNEADLTLKSHLEYLYYAIISLLSVSKLNRLFDRAANFDLKRLLQGTDIILDALLTRIQRDTTAMRGTLQPLRIDAALRHDTGAALIPTRSKAQRPQDALYCLLLTRNGLITVARASSHSIHPIDCQLLINTVFATKALKEGGTQSWVPICLPKFAPQGFVYAHVSFLDEEVQSMLATRREPKGSDASTASRDQIDSARPELGLVLVTGNPDGFDEMSAWRTRIVEKLQGQDLLLRLWRQIRPLSRSEGSDDASNSSRSSLGKHRACYSADELGLPGLRHFCFKWRSNVQSTSPQFEEAYEPGSEGHRRLLYLYGLAHEYVVQTKARPVEDANGASTSSTSPKPAVQGDGAPSLQSTPARSDSPPIIPKSVLGRATTAVSQTLSAPKPPAMHVVRTQHEAVLAWNTQPFELAIAASPHMAGPALHKLARAVAKWVKQEEHRLFIVSAPIF